MLLTSLFRRGRRSLENPSTPLSAPDDWLYDALGAYRATSGVNVNRETSLTYAAWWRGVNLISRDVAKLPVHVYRLDAGGGREKDNKHPAYPLLRRRPNREMTAFTWRQTMMLHCLCEGNGYSFIDRAGNGDPVELIPLQPTQTYPVRADGVLWYVYEPAAGGMRKIPAADILHIKGLSYDGLVGYNVIAKARESLGLGMALDTYGSTFFRNNATPAVTLETPNKLSPEAVKNLRESWDRMHSGLENSHKTAILMEGLTAKAISISAKDSQLLAQRQFQVREVALWFGLPPHKLGDMEAASYNSLEQENQAYLDSAIDPWLVNWEQECAEKLLTEAQKERETHLVEFDRKALIRANMSERAIYYHNGLADGWLSRDEVRAEEGYNPIEDGTGSQYLVPLNMGAAEQKGDADPPPDDTAADQAERLAKLAAVHRRMLNDLCRRLAKKVGTQAERAAKEPGKFMMWLRELVPTHCGTFRNAFAPLKEAVDLSCPGQSILMAAEHFAARLHSELLDLSGRCTAATLAAGVAEFFARYEDGSRDSETLALLLGEQ